MRRTGLVLLTAAALAASGLALSIADRAHAATVPPGFTDSLVATVTSPTTIESLPDGRLVVLEQDGRVRAGFPGQALPVVLQLNDVCSNSERGLLGFAHDPGFLTNRRVYLYRTRRAPDAPGGCVNRVSRFEMAGAIDPATETVLLDGISSVNGNHNGGDLDVGSDGFLYVGVGDAGRDPRGDSGSASSNDAARDLSLLNGKILRITLDGAPAPGNPLLGAGSERCATRGNTPATPTSPCQEIYAWGLRNPYRFAFDPNGGGDRFLINDVGQGSREEVDEGGVGRDFGWNLCEGPCPPDAPGGLTEPLTSYPRTVGTYITGGAIVPDGVWPADLDGGYLFSDGGTGKIFLRDAAGDVDYDQPWATGASGIADMVFAFDQDGRLALYYVRNGNGEVRRITWDGAGPSPTPSGLAFDGVAPTRVYDTRAGLGVVAGDVRSDTTRLVATHPPDQSVRAVLVNVTMTNNAGWGFVEAWSPRSTRPPTSVVNVVQPGEDVANAAVVTLDGDGRFVLRTTTATDVVVDVLGWFRETPGSSQAGRFVGVSPGRLVDSRKPAGEVLPSGSPNAYTESLGRFEVPVAGQLGLPSAVDVDAVVVVLTALAGGIDQSGFATAHPSGSAAPNASNVNTSGGGDIRANLVVVPLGADGSLSISVERVEDVLVDVVGYVTSASADSSAAGLFTAVTPTRLHDSRTSSTRPPSGRVVELDVGGALPAAVGAGAVLHNVTMTDTTGFDFVTAFPGGSPVPVVSNVNATAPGQTRAALAVTPLGPGATIGYTTLADSHLVVDVFGFFTG